MLKSLLKSKLLVYLLAEHKAPRRGHSKSRSPTSDYDDWHSSEEDYPEERSTVIDGRKSSGRGSSRASSSRSAPDPRDRSGRHRDREGDSRRDREGDSRSGRERDGRRDLEGESRRGNSPFRRDGYRDAPQERRSRSRGRDDETEEKNSRFVVADGVQWDPTYEQQVLALNRFLGLETHPETIYKEASLSRDEHFEIVCFTAFPSGPPKWEFDILGSPYLTELICIIVKKLIVNVVFPATNFNHFS